MEDTLVRCKAIYRLYRRKFRSTANYVKNNKPAFYWSILSATTLMISTCLLLLVTFFAVRIGIIGNVPSSSDLNDIRNYEASQALDTSGKTLGKYYIQNRLNADFEEINEHTIQALVSTEDSRFYKHQGIDYRSWLRVFFKSILLNDKSSGGGSTISQQLAKNLYPRQDYPILGIIINKFREFIIARRLEKIYAKNDILKLYLNTVPFSENIYGIKVAAQRFYNKAPKYLKMDEAATLIGSLKATTRLNPRRYPERALKRRNVVFQQMLNQGHLTSQELDSLSSLPLDLKYSEEGHDEGVATHFRELVRREAKELLSSIQKPDGSYYNIYTDGLQIHTTIDIGLQEHAEQAVAWHMARLQKQFDDHWKRGIPWKTNGVQKAALASMPFFESLKSNRKDEHEIDLVLKSQRTYDFFSWDGRKEVTATILDSIQYYNSLLNAGFVVMDTKGIVKAWIGGISFKDFKYDMVTAKRQVGSTFKPIVYASALQNGYTPCELIPNQLTIYSEYEDWKPENADNEYGGFYSVLGGMVGSVNTIAVQLIVNSGIEKVIQLASDLGIQSEIPEVPSIALGTANLSLLEMTGLYQSLANQGKHRPPLFISKITDRNGTTIVKKENTTEQEPAISDTLSYLLTEMLQTVVDSGTGRRLVTQFGLTNDIAGKTGTTQSHADGWFIGYTPTLVGGVRVGASSPEVHFRSLSLGQGSNMALPIFGKFMTSLKKDSRYRHLVNETFPEPPDTVNTMLNCPLYLTEDEYLNLQEEKRLLDILEDLLGPNRPEEHNLGDIIKDVFKKERNIRSKESERIRKRNERIRKRRERQKKKGIFKKILGN